MFVSNSGLSKPEILSQKNPMFLTSACLILLQYVVYPLHGESKEHKVHAYSIQIYTGWAPQEAHSQFHSGLTRDCNTSEKSLSYVGPGKWSAAGILDKRICHHAE